MGAELTLFALYARLGICRLPSYWSTRNRSIDKRPTGQQKQWRAAGSLFKACAINTGSALPFVKAGWRVPDDRFLVLQYEGVWHAPSRPQKLPRELGTPALRGLPEVGRLMAWSGMGGRLDLPR